MYKGTLSPGAPPSPGVDDGGSAAGPELVDDAEEPPHEVSGERRALDVASQFSGN